MRYSKLLRLLVLCLFLQVGVMTTSALAMDCETVEDCLKEQGLGWLFGLHWKADFLLRYEYINENDYYYDSHDDSYDDNDRHRGRFRLRFGFTKVYEDGIKVGFRLATGSDSYPNSTMQTLEGLFSEKHVWIDEAYIAYCPPVVEGLTLAGGKFEMPFETADILWDADVNPEGLYQKMVINAGPVHPFFTLGQFFLEEDPEDHDNSVAHHDPGILAGQLGIKVAMDTVYFLLAGTYYDFDEYENAGVFQQACGNPIGPDGSLAADDFNIFDLIGEFGMKFGKIPFKVKLIWLVNTAEDADEERYWEGKDTAWAAYVNLGKCKEKYDWEIVYKYGVIEANALPGGFSDGTFGGANREGHKIGVGFQPWQRASLHLTAYFTEKADTHEHECDCEETVFQGDVKVKL